MTVTVKQYQDAITNALSEKQVELLQALLEFPNSTATAKELAEKLGFSSYQYCNIQIGKTGKTITDYLGIKPSSTYYDRGKKRLAYFLIIGPYYPDEGEGKKRGMGPGWEMNKNLRTALKRFKSGLHNNTYLFMWNSKPENWSDYDNSKEKFALEGKCDVRWRCNTKAIKPGDRAFLIKIGRVPKGIIGSGIVTSFVSDLSVEIKLDILLDCAKDKILNIDALKSEALAKQNWTPQASGVSIKPEVAEELEKVWADFLTSVGIKFNPIISLDIARNTFFEGESYQTTLTRYERDTNARKECVDYYGVSCSVCGFNFENQYGEIGKDFIHVHHLTQLATTGENHETNPIKDLRPVCPNCHAMLHKRNPAYTIEELKSLISA